MSADLLSNFIGMTLQATGNNNNDWGRILNGSLSSGGMVRDAPKERGGA
jgi:hypothetical protein